ncbi:MAG TPA: tRNA uracil 4-sulfurtransferase ThiI [Vicinamibacterales bacterium]
MRSVIVHYQEIALKGRNRPWFIERLTQNLRTATADLDVQEVRTLAGRIELVLGPSAEWEQVKARLSTVFGIANFSQAGQTAPDLDALGEAILRDLGDRSPRSFRVSARRADKRFPMTSPAIEAAIGGRVKAATGWQVDLSDPEFVIRVEMLHDRAFYAFGRERGAGGLPTGVSGRVACLMSGGIDSPVAAWRMMRRGCRVQLIHFHSYPLVSDVSQEKARNLARVLARYQLKLRLHLVPFGDVQKQVILTVPAPLRVVIYRRLMLRIAERLARRGKSRALVTGEAIGQVASQTLDNLVVIGSVATMPIFRPLIGMDKDEVVAEAQRIGTYPISIVPDEDCCQLFTPRNPVTRATAATVDAAESSLSIDSLIQMAVDGTVMEEYRYPMVQSAARS